MITPQQFRPFGIRFPKEIVEKLDETRGDIPRSKFLQRLVERELEQHEKEKGEQQKIAAVGAAVSK